MRLRKVGELAPGAAINPPPCVRADLEVLADLLAGTRLWRSRRTPMLTQLKAKSVDLASFGEVLTELQ